MKPIEIQKVIKSLNFRAKKRTEEQLKEIYLNPAWQSDRYSFDRKYKAQESRDLKRNFR